MNTVSVQLPEPLAERLHDEAQRRHVAPDQIVQEALEKTLLEPDKNIGLPSQNLTEAAEKFIGRFIGSPEDFATNPRYLDDFGK